MVEAWSTGTTTASATAGCALRCSPPAKTCRAWLAWVQSMMVIVWSTGRATVPDAAGRALRAFSTGQNMQHIRRLGTACVHAGPVYKLCPSKARKGRRAPQRPGRVLLSSRAATSKQQLATTKQIPRLRVRSYT
eukprot:1162014-Pelagomonas_calceolata.AAC.5